MAQLQLCIVMPAYNEEECISAVVESWVAELESLEIQPARIIIVNDGSRDGTGAVLDQLAKQHEVLTVIHQENSGHGIALRSAYEHALSLDPEWVFHVDSDDQFFATDLRQLWEKREKSAFILGYRKLRHDAFHRLIITRILRAVNLLLFGRYVRDANVPYRLINAHYLKLLLDVVPDDVFAPNIFIAILAALDGQDLMHLPVTHRDRQTGTVSIVKWNLIKICFRCVKELFMFRLRLKTNLKYLAENRKKNES